MGYGKKRKRNETKYTCQICLTDRIESRFPDINPTSTCKHLINTCTKCLQDWIKSQLADTVFTGGVRCPECEEMMDGDDIKLLASKKTIKQFVDLDRRRIENDTPGWYWCLNADCTSGQVHPFILKQYAATQPGPEVVKKKRTQPRKTSKPQPETLFTCNECASLFCVSCNRPWHADETCEQYAKRTTGEHAIAEMKSQKAMGKVSKKCPSCQRPTIRHGGCRHMWCILCDASWCWTCVETFDDSGCACTRKAMQRRSTSA